MNLERMLVGDTGSVAKGLGKSGQSDSSVSDEAASEFSDLIDKAGGEAGGRNGQGQGLSEATRDDGEISDAEIKPGPPGREAGAAGLATEFESALDKAALQSQGANGEQGVNVAGLQDEGVADGAISGDEAVLGKEAIDGLDDSGGVQTRAQSGLALQDDGAQAFSNTPALHDPKNQLTQQSALSQSSQTPAGEQRVSDLASIVSAAVGREKLSQTSSDPASLAASSQGQRTVPVSSQTDAADLFADVPEILQSLEQVSQRRGRAGAQAEEAAVANPASVKARVVGQETHLPIVPQWRLAAQAGANKSVDATQVPADGELEAQLAVPKDAKAVSLDTTAERQVSRSELTTDVVKDGRQDAGQPGVAQQLGDRIRDALKTSGPQSANDLARLQGMGQQQNSTQGSQLVKILDVELTPEHLGSVTVRLALKGDALSVHVTAGSQAALSQLAADKDILTEVLKRSGYVVDEVVIVKTEFEPSRQTFGQMRNDTDPQQQRMDFGRGGEGDRGGAGGDDAMRGFDHGGDGEPNKSDTADAGGEPTDARSSDTAQNGNDLGRVADGIVV
ncbi:MAG: flagellar hook-length control protein FliK [Filomicrobium sp.]